jgi:signal transduction histidine kinase
MAQSPAAGPLPLHRDPPRLIWLALFTLAAATYIKCIPGSLREARRPSEMNADEFAKLVAAVARLHLTLNSFVYVQIAISLLTGIVAIAISWLLINARQRNRFVVIAAYTIICLQAATYPPDIDKVLPGEPVWQGLTIAITFVGICGFFLVPFIFPDGRLVPKWTLAPVLISFVLNAIVALAPYRILDSVAGQVLDVGTGLILVGMMATSVIIRYRRYSTAVERQQTKWIVFGLLLAMPLFYIGDFMMRHITGSTFGLICLIGFTLIMPIAFSIPTFAIGIAILHHRLFDIDLLLSRTLLWLTLTVAVIGTYIGIVLGLGSLLGIADNVLLSLIATGLVAVLFQPVSVRVRGFIRQFVYGAQAEPYAVLSALGHRIETAASEELLPAIVRTTVEALSLSYAALFLDAPGGQLLAASTGTPTALTLSLPLTHGGARIGTLEIGERTPGDTFSRADRVLLEDLARQIGVAARTVSLANDLQHSREQIVLAREEERRRLRRDLHDGLGSQLAALHIQTGQIRGLIHTNGTAAEAELGKVREELRAAIGNIRRVVLGLRPPALDELGLVGALQERLDRLAPGGLDAGESQVRIQFRPAPDLPPLPAAVEVAIFRITEEAVTNIIKHAGARLATVDLGMAEGGIRLEIADDGLGIREPDSGGAGMGSMQQRAAELGGACRVGPRAEGSGTAVIATIPVVGASTA